MARALRGKLAMGALLAWGVLGALAACTPAPPPPTVVELTLTASKDVNPTPSGQAAPVQLVVYQLGSSSSFDSAEFFQLLHQDKATLGTDLVKRDEFLLAPGQTKTTALMPTDQVKTLAVFAAYQNFQAATWRGTVPIPPHQTTNVIVTAGKSGVTIATAKPGS